MPRLSIAVVLSISLFSFTFFGCSDNDPDVSTDQGWVQKDRGAIPDASVGDQAGATPDAAAADTGAATGTRVTMVTSLGTIVVELNAAKAPKTVANFLRYVDAKKYDGTIFHRVISTFMIQGGGYDASYNKVATYTPIKNEADNGLSNLRGTIAMARTSVVDSATNQFFINVKDNTFLDHTGKTSSQAWGYAVFGKVVSGMDTVDKIKAVKTGAKGPFSKDAPLTNLVITSVTRGK